MGLALTLIDANTRSDHGLIAALPRLLSAIQKQGVDASSFALGHILVPADYADIRMLVEGEDAAGHSVALSSQATRQDIPLPDGWKRMIGDQLKAHGYSYLLLDTTSPIFDDVRNTPGQWGITLVAEHKSYFLYKLL